MKTATRWSCYTTSCTAGGSGRGPERCPKCGGRSTFQTAGVYAVYVWRGDGRYKLEDAKGHRLTERAADALAARLDPGDLSLVVRFTLI